jgi:predicted PurR-regulated permease PerM
VDFPPTWHALIFGGVLVGLAVLVILTQEALAPYIIALILVFLMNGLVDRLQRAGVPRWGGTLIAILALIAAIVAFIYLVLDALLDQLATLISSLPEISGVVGEFLRGL